MKTVFKALLITFIFTGTNNLQAACLILNSNGKQTSFMADPLYLILKNEAGCPQNVQGLKSSIDKVGLKTEPYMVANRGIHNPQLGSFSFFEQVIGTSPSLAQQVTAGEFFFGHFTSMENGIVIADQEPGNGKLLIELIVWDNTKKLFNFYELIGTENGVQWFYRGDSKDILTDNALLYLNSQKPQFGSALRCSACHTSGGPIMKELAAPHNDWWTTARPLTIAPNETSPEIANWMQKLHNASKLSQSVKAGIDRLETSSEYQKAKQSLSVQATLRPLFCETEINLESDFLPLELASSAIQIPSASIVNSFLVQGSVNMATPAYKQILKTFDMQFPETNERDADHGWLVPVKGFSDMAAINSLIKNGIVTDEFVADVLAVDFENPLFSSKRCALVQLIPADGLANFPDQLKASTLPGANELYENLKNPKRTKIYHGQRAQEFLIRTQLELNSVDGQTQLFNNLLQKRQSVFKAEISKNIRGQILEPGFRVIFPKPR